VTAVRQGEVAARNILGGDEAYCRLPHLFTDQYNLGMELVGARCRPVLPARW
jgi:hypothetical protein